jgi:small subunit ribosomal protein S8e
VRTRGGNRKFRALRLETGNFAWASQGTARKTRVLDVVYNASNNELVRTKTLVKNCIITIDATPFKQYYEGHFLLPLGRRKDGKSNLAEGEEDPITKKRGKDALKKYEARQKFAKVEQALEEQFLQGRLLGKHHH